VVTQELEIKKAHWAAESARFSRDQNEKASQGLEEDMATVKLRKEALEREVGR
jgi:hypothetical protein